MKKLLGYMMTMVMSMSVLTGCSGTTNTPAPSQGDETTKAEKPAKKVDMLLWLPPFGSGDALDLEFWRSKLQPWAEEKNVNLSIEITPWGGYEEKYLTGFASGEGPDIGYMYNEMFNDFIEMGVLEDIDPFFTAKEKDNYLYWEKGTMKGGQYTLPFIVGNARIPYFNMDLLAQAGVTEVPKTWDELIEVAKKVDEANIEGVLPFSQEWADPAIGALNNLFYPYLWQAGGDLYNEDGTKVALMDNDAAVRAAQFLYDLKFTHGVLKEESLALVGQAQRDLFCQGKVAIASMDANAAKYLDEANINWEFVPSFTDKEKAIWVASDSLIMNSASKNKELAADLMKYITSAGTMSAFHTEIASFPPITKDGIYNDNERFKEMYENDIEYFHTLPVASGSFKVMDTLYKNLQQMMLGDLTPEEAIQKTVDYSGSILPK